MAIFNHQTIAKANRDYYNAVAKEYSDNEAYAYSEDIVKDVEGLIHYGAGLLKCKDKFLDFGCGSGFLSEIVCKTNLFNSVVGCDISESQIKIYKEKLGDRINAVICDLAYMPLKSSTIDMAACYSVLHHIFDYELVLEEVARVLKPGGILYFDFEPNRKFQKTMLIPLRLRRKLFDKAPGKLDDLEHIAEYHNQIQPGIDKNNLLRFLSNDFDIMKVGQRFPRSMATLILKVMSRVSSAFTPYFYVISRKKKKA